MLKTPLSSIVSQSKQNLRMVAELCYGDGEVLKLAAKPVQNDNVEKTWLEFRFKLENYLTLVDERNVALPLNAESQPVANLPTGTEESAVTIRTMSHTLYALLATLTTG